MDRPFSTLVALQRLGLLWDIQPGVKLRGRLEKEDGFDFIRLSSDDGHIERCIVTGKQFAN